MVVLSHACIPQDSLDIILIKEYRDHIFHLELFIQRIEMHGLRVHQKV